MQLTGTGVWSGQLRFGDAGEKCEAATELEALGYSAIWLPGRRRRRGLRRLPRAARSHGAHPAGDGDPEPLDAHTGGDGGRPRRGDGGVPGSLPARDRHQPRAAPRDAGPSPTATRSPSRRPRAFLDDLDAATPPVPVAERCLAALGPKMLELARDRTAGAHPYLVVPEHTRTAPRDPRAGRAARARAGRVPRHRPDAAARRRPATTCRSTSTCPTTRTTGCARASPPTTSSTAAATVCATRWSRGATRRRSPGACREHHDAGADHVCIQVVTAPDAGPRRGCGHAARRLARPRPRPARAELPPTESGRRLAVPGGVGDAPVAQLVLADAASTLSLRGRSSTHLHVARQHEPRHVAARGT